VEDVGQFHGHLVYFTAIWYILWPFGIFMVIWSIVFFFDKSYQEKSGNPGPDVPVKNIAHNAALPILCHI
jgi:hypothetical protein